MDNNQNTNPGKVEQKNIALCVILSIVTCGLYGLYWLYTLTEDTKTLLGDANGTSGGIVVLLSIVTCNIYNLYWMFTQGEKIDRIKTSRGLPSSNSGILYLILSLFGLSIISYAIMQSEINKVA